MIICPAEVKGGKRCGYVYKVSLQFSRMGLGIIHPYFPFNKENEAQKKITELPNARTEIWTKHLQIKTFSFE